ITELSSQSPFKLSFSIFIQTQKLRRENDSKNHLEVCVHLKSCQKIERQTRKDGTCSMIQHSWCSNHIGSSQRVFIFVCVDKGLGFFDLVH
ncbi:hypothetical protein LINPERHAP2_LOCUS37021, partial [Linum perenne]